MSSFDQSSLMRPSLLASQFDTGLDMFASAGDALAAYARDDAFCLLYPQTIARAAQAFLSGFPGKVLYAVKANPHPAVLQTLWASGLRAFDVASIAEIDLVRRVAPDAAMYLMHPVKSRQTIRHAVRVGIRDFAFDSAAELDKIFSETATPKSLRLHLRLALPEAVAHMPLIGKFGAPFAEAVQLLRRVADSGAEVGVTFHVGSQCHDPSQYHKAIGSVRSLVNAAGVQLSSLDCGGGFAIAYPGLTPPPLGTYFAAIRSALDEFSFDEIDILGEPGRALCAQGGATMVRVELRRKRDLYINDGIYGTLFDAGTFGWRFPTRLHRLGETRRGAAPSKGFRLMGPTCDSHDILEGPFELPADVAEGDWIEIQNTGAYAQALATRFNGFGPIETFAIADSASD